MILDDQARTLRVAVMAFCPTRLGGKLGGRDSILRQRRREMVVPVVLVVALAEIVEREFVEREMTLYEY